MHPCTLRKGCSLSLQDQELSAPKYTTLSIQQKERQPLFTSEKEKRTV